MTDVISNMIYVSYYKKERSGTIKQIAIKHIAIEKRERYTKSIKIVQDDGSSHQIYIHT